MSTSESTSRWGNRALNLALAGVGVAVMALLYALVSQHVGSWWGAPAAGDASTPAEPAAATAAGAWPGEAAAGGIVQVSIRNGCGEEGLAARTRDYLVRAGFDVVEVGNYRTFDVDTSVVIDRAGDRAAARRVARAVGLPARRVRQEAGPEYYLDASLVLGCDYPALRPFRNAPAGSGAP